MSSLDVCLRLFEKPRNILRGFAYLSLIGTGAIGMVMVPWLQPPSLDTYEDECFMPEELPTLGRSYSLQEYIGCIHCRDGRELRAEEQWAVDWLSLRAQGIVSNNIRVQGEISQLDYIREQCEEQARRCSGKRAIYHFADCFKRRWNNGPWRERAKTMVVLIRDRQLQMEAMEGANCIICSVTRPFYAGCPDGRLPAILTDAECCFRIQRRGPEVQRMLPMYGVSCPGEATE